MPNEIVISETGIVFDETNRITLVKLCRYSALPAERILEMVEQGLIEPIDASGAYSHWQFTGNSLLRIQKALRLQRDLGVNLAGAVLALELLDEVKQLREQLACSRG